MDNLKITEERTKEYILEMTNIAMSENINVLVESVDDNYTSELLKYYSTIMLKYFDQENSNELISFKETKEEVGSKIKDPKKKMVFKREMELLSLIEYIYMTKYDKLIKKLIYKTTKTRFFHTTGGYNPLNDPAFYENLKNEAVSFATEGFLIGIRRYHPKSQTKLITYVTWWIQQRIVYFIEKYSTINKGHKVIINDEDMIEKEYDHNGELKFNKYANIKFENYNFIKTEDVERPDDLEKLTSMEEGYDRHGGKIYDIVQFFCQNNDLFLYFEYLIIKYDILLEEYIYFIDNVKDEQIKECFYKQINEVVDTLKRRGYKELEDFQGVDTYHKLPETLILFFNLDKSEYLSVKRVLKQKLVNILKNVFLEKKPNRKRKENKDD